MSVRQMKNYDEWPYWYELASMMVTVAIFKIVRNGVCHIGWHESPSAIVDMSRDDIVDFVAMQRRSLMEMASSPAAMMSICDGLDLSDELTLTVQAASLSDYLTGKESVEPLECTPSGKAWNQMCEYLKRSKSFTALLAFIAEWHGGEIMRTRLRKYGLFVTTTSCDYRAIESSFKDAYPNDFKKGFWASLFG